MTVTLPLVLLSWNMLSAGQAEASATPSLPAEIGCPAVVQPHVPPALTEPYAPTGTAITWTDPRPPVPVGSWWHGALVPIVQQRTLYYPTWDHPIRTWRGMPLRGEAANDVPQGAVPVFWKRIGQ